jgi:hypothetical protein
MDALAARDWGVYYHFRFVAKHHPEIMPAMELAYYISTYVGAATLVLLAAILFLLQGKRRSSLVVLTTFGAAILLVEGLHSLIPSPRPPDAQNWLGPDAMQGSYPSSGVLMFLLSVILLGFAVWGMVGPWLRGLYVAVGTGFTVWVCMSQFFLGIHFLTEVIGGIIGAILLSLLTYRSHFQI